MKHNYPPTLSSISLGKSSHNGLGRVNSVKVFTQNEIKSLQEQLKAQGKLTYAKPSKDLATALLDNYKAHLEDMGQVYDLKFHTKQEVIEAFKKYQTLLGVK